MDNENELLRVSEVARLINVSPATVYTWVKQEKIPCFKFVGGHQDKKIGSGGVV